MKITNLNDAKYESFMSSFIALIHFLKLISLFRLKTQYPKWNSM